MSSQKDVITPTDRAEALLSYRAGRGTVAAPSILIANYSNFGIIKLDVKVV